MSWSTWASVVSLLFGGGLAYILGERRGRRAQIPKKTAPSPPFTTPRKRTAIGWEPELSPNEPTTIATELTIKPPRSPTELEEDVVLLPQEPHLPGKQGDEPKEETVCSPDDQAELRELSTLEWLQQAVKIHSLAMSERTSERNVNLDPMMTSTPPDWTSDTPHSLADLANPRAMEHKMIQALENGEFVVYFQPIYQIKPLLLVGLEALLRMQTKKFGLVLPVQFIPELEQSGFILQVGQWMLETVCSQMEQWQSNGVGAIAVSVNMSALQFRTPQLVSSLRQHLDSHQLLPQSLPVEIKEKALTEDWDHSQRVVQELRNAGLPIIADNYGTGKVPLQQLAEAGIFQVKLDISLMKALMGNPDTLTHVQAIVSQAQRLQMRVIAKGVESDSQLKLLEVMKCTMAQGFYMGEPLPAKTIPSLLKAQRSES